MMPPRQVLYPTFADGRRKTTILERVIESAGPRSVPAGLEIRAFSP